MHLPTIVWFGLSVIVLLVTGFYLITSIRSEPIEYRKRRMITTSAFLTFLLLWLIFFYFIMPVITAMMVGGPH